jgi:hypothetical protein
MTEEKTPQFNTPYCEFYQSLLLNRLYRGLNSKFAGRKPVSFPWGYLVWTCRRKILSHLLKNFNFPGCESFWVASSSQIPWIVFRQNQMTPGTYFQDRLCASLGLIGHMSGFRFIGISMRILGCFLRKGAVIERRIFLALELFGAGNFLHPSQGTSLFSPTIGGFSWPNISNLGFVQSVGFPLCGRNCRT